MLQSTSYIQEIPGTPEYLVIRVDRPCYGSSHHHTPTHPQSKSTLSRANFGNKIVAQQQSILCRSFFQSMHVRIHILIISCRYDLQFFTCNGMWYTVIMYLVHTQGVRTWYMIYQGTWYSPYDMIRYARINTGTTTTTLLYDIRPVQVVAVARAIPDTYHTWHNL